MTIRAKIWLVSGITLVVIIGISGFLFFLDRQADKSLADQIVATDIIASFYIRNVIVSDYLINRSERARLQLEIAEQRVDQNFAVAESLFITPEKKEIFNNLLISRTKVKEFAKDLLAHIQEHSHSENRDESVPELYKAENELEIRLTGNLLVQSQTSADLASELAKLSLNELRKNQRIFEYVSIGGMAGILIMVLIFMLILSRSVIKPINKLRLGAEAIGKGNLDYKINIKAKDEIGKLASNFNEMTAKLKELYEKLEERVKERTKQLTESERNLETIIKEGERINKVMIDRELKMVELKKEIVDLKEKLKINSK